mmetsp:Transcript_12386/g.36310  ORF Transcript_12386/g.36310 Transcript_12386/m.36310 type:complete len:209 (+) Transcript_12386:682-1308(+)
MSLTSQAFLFLVLLSNPPSVNSTTSPTFNAGHNKSNSWTYISSSLAGASTSLPKNPKPLGRSHHLQKATWRPAVDGGGKALSLGGGVGGLVTPGASSVTGAMSADGWGAPPFLRKGLTYVDVGGIGGGGGGAIIGGAIIGGGRVGWGPAARNAGGGGPPVSGKTSASFAFNLPPTSLPRMNTVRSFFAGGLEVRGSPLSGSNPLTSKP